MKNKKHLLALLFTCAILSSCTPLVLYSPSHSSENAISSKDPRKYEAYGDYLTADQVEAFCKAYSKNDPDGYYIRGYLGLFREKTHVLLVRFAKEGFAATEAVRSFYVADIYVCDGWDGSYSLAVWVEGEGAYGIQKAYENGKISEEEIRSAADKAERLGLRQYGHLAVPLEKFTFSLAWGPDYKYYYESKDGGFLTTLNGESVIPAEYYTSFEYPNLERVYEKAKQMSIYSYNTHAYEGPEDISSRMNDFKITLDDKEIEMTNVPNIDSSSNYPSYGIQGLFPIVFEIRDTIMNSDQWKSLAGHD